MELDKTKVLRGISFVRARRIAGYNWPLYAAAAVGILGCVVLACLPNVPPLIRWLGCAGAVVAAWFACRFGRFT